LISQIVAEFREVISLGAARPWSNTLVDNLCGKLVGLPGGKVGPKRHLAGNVRPKRHPCGKVFGCCVLSVPSLGAAEIDEATEQDGDLGT
jgi:hypothetical protein